MPRITLGFHKLPLSQCHSQILDSQGCHRSLIRSTMQDIEQHIFSKYWHMHDWHVVTTSLIYLCTPEKKDLGTFQVPLRLHSHLTIWNSGQNRHNSATVPNCMAIAKQRAFRCHYPLMAPQTQCNSHATGSH